MPVGCLGNAARGPKDEPFTKKTIPEFETMLTSSRLNSTDQFAFMQQTLLLQIFRIHEDEVQSDSKSNSESSESSSILCPTCVGFSDHCCQQDYGIEIFNELIEANLNCFWDSNLYDAISSLRYQGYICPGILVMIANPSCIETITDAWHRHLITSPESHRISQVGVSNGCLVKPIVQTHTISLPDFLCLQLARLKQTQQIVDMEVLCKAVEQEWNGVAPFCRTNGVETLRETIHSNLGMLIKQRKVYYTGNKGYFLVPAETNSKNGVENRSWRRFTPKRLSLRNGKSKMAANTSDKECQTDVAGQISPGRKSVCSISSRSSDNESSPVSFNLERSQSLRISKQSFRNMSKGGSLRYSKREVARMIAEQNEKNCDSQNGNTSPARQFERKNSFLGRIFGSSSKKRSQGPKPIIATFSAQFPPPELSESDPHETYQALKKVAQSIYNSPPPLIPATEVQRQGDDIYDRPQTDFPIYSKVIRKKVVNFPDEQQNVYNSVNAIGASPDFLYSSPPPPLPYRPSNWSNGPNSLQSSTSSTSSPTHRLLSSPRPVNSPTNSGSPCRNSPSILKPSTPLQKLQQLQFNHQHQLQLQQLHHYQLQSSVQGTHTTSGSPWSSPAKGTYVTANDPANMSESSNMESSTTKPLFSEDLLVIERSNKELELKLTPTKNQAPPKTYQTPPTQSNGSVTTVTQNSIKVYQQTPQPVYQALKVLPANSKQDLSPKSHNKPTNEEESPASKKNRAIRFTLPTSHKNRNAIVIDTIHNNNAATYADVIYDDDQHLKQKVTRPLSECFASTQEGNMDERSNFPSIADLPSVTELSGNTNFKSLTAQKLMSGLNFNSVDTLLEVNAAAEARSRHDESTETVDFGVI